MVLALGFLGKSNNKWFPKPNGHVPGCLYIRKIKMGVGKEKWGWVGFGRTLCVSTQLFGPATEKQREQNKAREVKSGA